MVALDGPGNPVTVRALVLRPVSGLVGAASGRFPIILFVIMRLWAINRAGRPAQPNRASDAGAYLPPLGEPGSV